MSWRIPRMWEGETCAILASGPSMDQSVADSVKAAGVRAIAVCRTWELAPWSDLIYAADSMWWNAYYGQVKNLGAIKVACEEAAAMYPDVNVLKSGPLEGFSNDAGIVCTGGNSGYQAICVAAHAGCKQILLCGFDMQGKHWHPEYKHPLRVHEKDIYERWIARFYTLKAPLAERDIEVINCTPNSALKVWPLIPLQQALKARVAA